MGPLVGTALVWLFLLGPLLVASLVQNGFEGSVLGFVGSAIGAVLVSILAGYALGGVPALVTGVVCSAFAQALKSDWLWLGACTALGFAITFAGCYLFSLDLVMRSQIGAIGAAAAAACAFLLRRDRWAN